MGYDEREEPTDESDVSSSAAEPGEAMEFEQAVSELESVEASRRRLFVAIGIGAVVALAVSILAVAEFREWFFQPKMPIEKTEREIVRKTDDPQCRELISEITNIGHTFFAMEGRLEEHVPGDDSEEIRKLDRELATLKERLEEAEELSGEANLRFEESREELDEWFRYVRNEIWVLRDVLANQLEELGVEPSATGDAGSGPDAGDVGAGQAEAEEADATGEGDPDAGTDGSETSEDGRPPAERRNGALVALHDAFENFRVWHKANLHPCGAASEDEEPWRPSGWEAEPDAGSSGGR